MDVPEDGDVFHGRGFAELGAYSIPHRTSWRRVRSYYGEEDEALFLASMCRVKSLPFRRELLNTWFALSQTAKAEPFMTMQTDGVVNAIVSHVNGESDTPVPTVMACEELMHTDDIYDDAPPPLEPGNGWCVNR